jgi:pyruvate/2-oxoglutarate dehydrogenase complex dihydrolipoamide acyltransferase (E2) component
LAKTVAGQKNIDLHGVQGSGPNGRIIEQDVQDIASKTASKTETKKTQ